MKARNDLSRNVGLPELYRAVRTETASFMAVLAPMVGRTLAKALKSLAGAWWLAQADPDPECSGTFKAAFLEVFPAAKQREALAFCRSQVTSSVTSPLCSPSAFHVVESLTTADTWTNLKSVTARGFVI